MKFVWLAIALAALAVMAANPTDARARRHHYKPRCVDQPVYFSWFGFWDNPRPRPNGCSLPVYQYGEYVGQDPDPFIRSQLLRDPSTGYSSSFAR